MPDSVWEKADGTWTAASYVVRSLCNTPELTSAELLFVLSSLGLKERFKDQWCDRRFSARAGLPLEADPAIDQGRRDWMALVGAHAWATGDITEAKRRYQDSIDNPDTSTLAGIAGLLRLHFVQGEYRACIDLFRNACPPHEYYEERTRISTAQASCEQATGRLPDNWWKEYSRLDRRFRRRSPCFISQAQYMCRAIVTAAAHAGGVDPELQQMICDYFEIESEQVSELLQASDCGQDEINRLRRKLAPKPVKAGRDLESLRTEGDTERARRLRELVPRSCSIVENAAALLDSYLATGDAEELEKMIAVGTPFGVADADGLILSHALESRAKEIEALPVRHLELLRRFNAICYMNQYPTDDFLRDYLEVMAATQAPAEPGDIIAAILDVQWYKTRYSLDYTGIGGVRGGLGKSEISEHREWLEVMLIGHPVVTDREHWESRDQAIARLYEAYLFLRDRFAEVKREERWISEAQLGDALAMLFGDTEIERHARPLWLSPQHLDFYLPRYKLAVEYMGAQHYQPVALFGGEVALKETQRRDARKKGLCDRMGVSLVYVTHEEDVGRRAREIHSEFNQLRADSIDGDADGV